MMRRAIVAAALAVAANAFAQEDVLKPNANLVADGLPPIPMETMRKVAPYNDFKPSRLYSWHPIRREMILGQRLKNTMQVHRVSEPGAPLEPLTDFRDSVGGAAYQPTTGEYFLFPRAEGGNETFRIYRFDVATKEVTAFTPESERAGGLAVARKGNLVAYTTQPVDRNNPDKKVWTKVHTVDPLKPKTDKVIATLDGGGWFNFSFSEDGRQLAFVEYRSAADSDIWVMDVATGKKRKVTRAARDEKVSWTKPRFSKDGKAIFATNDRGSEFQRLVYMPLSGGKDVPLTKDKFDVDDYEISFDANRIAFITNESGSHVLRFIDLATRKELPRPPLFDGVITGLEWRPKSDEVGFTVTSAHSAGDVFSYDVKSTRLARWTNGNNPALNTSAFVEPKLIRWKSFDNLEISGFLYQPDPAKHPGKRPVVLNVHGGPEAQARAGFIGNNNYLVNELGVAMIFPNVRGSAGFGKTFLKLDNGRKREDSVKDLGALIDWIKTQPDLDGDRVQVRGGSYGGYMTLASSVLLADRIAGAISMVGISNFVTFLERTESYRRDLRRMEYGDERDPEMRKFLEGIAPVNHAEKITKPLFVIQGLNDPRVPYTEAEQIVKSMKDRRRPVWSMMAKDEGHGFAKKPNQDYQFYATVEFAKQTLLK